MSQLDAALKSVRSAAEIERREGRLPSASLVCEAVILVLAGEFEAAGDCCTEVLRTEDPASALYMSAMQNLAGSLACRPLYGFEIVEARKLLRSVRERIRGIRETLARYSVWYAEGLLHGMMVEFRYAIDHLRSARSGFLRLNILPSYAMASVDLAIVHFRKEDEVGVRRVISRTVADLTQAEAGERLVEPFRQAEKEPTVQAAIERLRAGASRPPSAMRPVRAAATHRPSGTAEGVWLPPSD